MAWWLTQHLATVAVVAAIVDVTTRLLRASPGVRHLLWTIVLIKLVLPPVFAWPWSVGTATAPTHTLAHPSPATDVRPVRASGPAEQPPTSRGTSGTSRVDGAAPPATASAAARDWRTWASLVWLMGTCVFVLVHGGRAWRMGRLLRQARRAGADLNRRVDAVATAMSMAPVQIRLASIPSPVVWGGPRPAILWPEALPQSVPAQAIDGLLAHELAHVKRRDHWIGWLELAAGCAWWWNPLFWHVRRHVRANAELACDAWVAEVTPEDRRHFAEALLAFSGGSPSLPAPIPAIGVRSGHRRLMERRLAMIMRAHVPVRLSRLALCTAALVAALAFPAWAQRSTSTSPQPPSPAPRPSTSAAPATQPASPSEPPTVVRYTPARRIAVGRRSIAVAPVVVQTSAGGRTFDAVVPVTTQYVPSDEGDLPAEARELVRTFGETTAQTRRDAEDAIARERTALVDRLQKLQDSEARAGHLDQALAIRARVRALQRGTVLTYTYSTSTGGTVISPGEAGLSDGFVIAPPPPPPPPAPGRPAAPPEPPAPPRR